MLSTSLFSPIQCNAFVTKPKINEYSQGIVILVKLFSMIQTFYIFRLLVIFSNCNVMATMVLLSCVSMVCMWSAILF